MSRINIDEMEMNEPVCLGWTELEGLVLMMPCDRKSIAVYR